MDRYFAWLITDAEINPDAEIPEIFKPTSLKLVAAGFVVAITVVVYLASLGYIVYD